MPKFPWKFKRIQRYGTSYWVEVLKCPEGHKHIADGVSDKQKHLCEWIEEWK